MHNLLTDPLIGVRMPQGDTYLSLPGALAALVRGDLDGYTGQRAHQADPWHVFTVQLAASILARHPDQSADDPPTDPSFWHAGLMDLAVGRASAWHLVVEDVTQPAFLQHPLTGRREIEGKKPPFDVKANTPDELDVLVTSKNHDVKAARARADDGEAWLYALLAYQTTGGFLGQGNYGIVRMNGGFASRPVVSTVATLHPAYRFREELSLVCAMRPAVLRQRFGFHERGVALTWLKPWDRSGHQLQLHELEPCFIEACRPVRLVTLGDEIVALGATSKARQVGPKTIENGDVGDPWIPINTSGGEKRSALNVQADGFTPQLLTALLFENGYELTSLQRPRRSDGDLWFIGSVLARKKGGTKGFHRFAVPIPAEASDWLVDATKCDVLGKAAQNLIRDADTAQSALRVALLILAQGGPAAADFDATEVKKWIKSPMRTFAHRWSDDYFIHLWRRIGEAETNVRQSWREHLRQVTERLLTDAEARLPLPHNRRWRALSRSATALHGYLNSPTKGWQPLPPVTTLEANA